jgi:hypothetical protein
MSMKPNRISPKNNTKSPRKQGQTQAELGHPRFDTKGKPIIEAIRLGEALGLDENQIKALSLIAAFEGVTPIKLAKDVLLFSLKASVENAEIQIRDGKSMEEKLPFSNLLCALPPIFLIPRNSADLPMPRREIDMGDAKMLLEEAVRQASAFQLLLLNSLESESAAVFRSNRGHLAAGVQTIMFHVRDRLENTYDAVRKADRPITP